MLTKYIQKNAYSKNQCFGTIWTIVKNLGKAEKLLQEALNRKYFRKKLKFKHTENSRPTWHKTLRVQKNPSTLKVESKFRQAEKILVQLPSISVVSPNTLNQIKIILLYIFPEIKSIVDYCST